jgi:hypothetical protein
VHVVFKIATAHQFIFDIHKYLSTQFCVLCGLTRRVATRTRIGLL